MVLDEDLAGVAAIPKVTHEAVPGNVTSVCSLCLDPYKSLAPATSLQKQLARGPGRLFYRQLEQKAMRWPGIEPGLTAWKAAMLTTIPPTQAVLYI